MERRRRLSLALYLLIAIIGKFGADSQGDSNVLPEAKQGYLFGSRYFIEPFIQSPSVPLIVVPDSTTTKDTRKKNVPLGVLVAFLYLLLSQRTSPVTTSSATRTSATPPIMTTTPDFCFWGYWTSCSATCGGERKRYRTCAGVVDSQTERCNVKTGFSPSGWYRADNCKEYSWRRFSGDYDEAQTECYHLGGQLASAGFRNDTIRSVVMAKLAQQHGVAVGEAYIGATDRVTDRVYVWSDGVVENPTFWAPGQPDDTSDEEDCVMISIGDPFSLRDNYCDDSDNENYICERPV